MSSAWNRRLDHSGSAIFGRKRILPLITSVVRQSALEALTQRRFPSHHGDRRAPSPRQWQRRRSLFWQLKLGPVEECFYAQGCFLIFLSVCARRRRVGHHGRRTCRHSHIPRTRLVGQRHKTFLVVPGDKLVRMVRSVVKVNGLRNQRRPIDSEGVRGVKTCVDRNFWCQLSV